MNSDSGSVASLSSLTTVQVETLKIHLALKQGAINMHAALKMRKNVEVSRGTHYRIVGQAKKNIIQSLFTVATAVQLGLVKPEDVQKLIANVSLIPAEGDPEKLREVMMLFEALANRIVML